MTETLQKRTEKVVTKEVRKHLKGLDIFHWKQWQGMGSVKGTPDIVGIRTVKVSELVKRGIEEVGVFMAVEVKGDRGRLTPEQDKFLNEIRTRGGIGLVSRGGAELELQLETYYENH